MLVYNLDDNFVPPVLRGPNIRHRELFTKKGTIFEPLLRFSLVSRIQSRILPTFERQTMRLLFIYTFQLQMYWLGKDDPSAFTFCLNESSVDVYICMSSCFLL